MKFPKLFVIRFIFGDVGMNNWSPFCPNFFPVNEIIVRKTWQIYQNSQEI